MAFKITNKMH